MATNAIIKQLRELRQQFDAAHAEGLAAIARSDFQQLRIIIRTVGDLVDEQGKLVDALLRHDPHPRRRLRREV